MSAPISVRVDAVSHSGLWILSWACSVEFAKGSVVNGRLRLEDVAKWVLDAAFHTVEWSSQPLLFESVVLRSSLDQLFIDLACKVWYTQFDRRRTNWHLPSPG